MKKLLAVALCLVMALGLFAGCSKNSVNVTADDLAKLQSGKDKTDAPAATDSPSPDVSPKPSEPVEESNRYIGVVSGSSFSNPWSDISFTAPAGWKFATPAELRDNFNSLAEDATLADYEALDEVYDAAVTYEQDTAQSDSSRIAIVYINDKTSTPEQYINDELFYGMEDDNLELTETYTRTICGNSYTCIDIREANDTYVMYTSIACRRIDSGSLACVMVARRSGVTLDPSCIAELYKSVFPDSTTGNDYIPLADSMPINTGDVPYIPGYVENGRYYNDTCDLSFSVDETYWTVFTSDEMSEVFGDSALVNDEYLTAETISTIGDFAMYNEADMRMVMVMFVNCQAMAEYGGMSADQFALAMASGSGCEVLSDSEITGTGDAFIYCVDCTDNAGMYYSYITMESPDDYMCVVTIATDSEEELDYIFYDIFG